MPNHYLNQLWYIPKYDRKVGTVPAGNCTTAVSSKIWRFNTILYDILLVGPSGTYFSEIWIQMQFFPKNTHIWICLQNVAILSKSLCIKLCMKESWMEPSFDPCVNTYQVGYHSGLDWDMQSAEYKSLSWIWRVSPLWRIWFRRHKIVFATVKPIPFFIEWQSFTFTLFSFTL